MSMQRPEEIMAIRYQETRQMAEQCCYDDAIVRLKGPGASRRAIASVGRCIVALGKKMEAAERSRHYVPNWG
ncbi:hypothetical protein [Ktedonospora formicarum]|uniref:Uncharacterized protein n=1 Tax=Ktedonospora formicarum TaxID=2778364 RepID=A0A8J3MQF7_9CHLR|nr:hypothetical protein [Ktedonospora formicarum]GHO44862.1 hypothetical protein KSX_30250 [Ktedonospora formicarum]